MTTAPSRSIAEEPEGATPLDPDESDGLLPGHIHTRAELNQWEALNIAQAERWAFDQRGFDPLSVSALTTLHLHMFDRTWAWAGTLRRSDKSISPLHWTEVPRQLRDLVADTIVQRDSAGADATVLDDVAIRFHHLLVRIHPWPNGNGRHGRLASDLLVRQLRRAPFTWGMRSSAEGNDVRRAYVSALRAADRWDYDPLRAFVRS